jgi:IPT/TIG domain/Glucodextranase, domain B
MRSFVCEASSEGTLANMCTRMFSSVFLAAFALVGLATRAQGQATATFINSDTSTQGSWRGVYGGDGYSIANDSQSLPSYVSLGSQNQSNYTWTASTTDVRALQNGANTGRLAACWYSLTSLSFDVNFTDSNTHQFAIYALDWDNQGRSETIQITSAATGALLDTRTISGFANGIYLIWNISGNITITVSQVSGPNAVISGVFFGGPTGVLQSTGVSSTIGSITFARPVTAGNLLVATITCNQGWGNTLSVSDTLGSTWHQAYANGYNGSYAFWWATVPSAGNDTITPQSSGSCNILETAIAELDGVMVQDQLLESEGSYTSNVNSGSVTTAEPNEILIGVIQAIYNQGGSTPTSESGWTWGYETSAFSLEYQTVSATGSYAATATYSPAPESWSAQIVTFMPTATVPVIYSISPTSGVATVYMTVSGAGFGSSQGASTVSVNGVTITPATWNPSAITLQVPPNVGSGPVVVTVNGAVSNSVNFAFSSGPGITQSTGSGITSSGSVAFANPVTTGNLLVAAITCNQGWGNTLSLSDTLGSTWHQAFANGYNGSYAFWWATAPSSGNDTITPHPSGSCTYLETAIAELYGVAAQDQSLESEGSYTSNMNSGSVTTAEPNEILIGVIQAIYNQGGSTPTSESGWTWGYETSAFSLEYQTVSATGSYAATATYSPAPESWSAQIVTFMGANGGSSPSISSLSPTSGAVGASVTITGTNFGAIPSTVTFNGTPASVITNWSATSITATVPPAATTGNVVVTAGGTASNGVNFAVSPSIASLSPVLEAVGIPVTIVGANFGSAQGSSSTLTFNGIQASVITNWSATSITAMVPPGATTGYVVVTVGGTSSNGELFVMIPTPTITSLSPVSGTPGTSVTISGANFGTSQGASTVTFNGVPAAVTNWSNNTVVANVPSNATTGDFIVTVAGVGSNGGAFTVTGPVIIGLSSDLGAVGDSVTVYGTGFGTTQRSSTMTFNGMSAAPTSWSNMTIVVPVPTGATTGLITVTVSGVSGSSANIFTVGSPDTISGLSITSPSNGATISTPYAAITGTITGRITGIDPIGVTCSGAPAKLTGTSFSCNVPIYTGANSIAVVGTDSGGDTVTSTVSVTFGMSAPTSLQITPPNSNMLVGSQQSFTAVDNQGNRRPDATWSVSNSTIASFASDNPNTLMANAVGQATVTATVGGVSAQTTVTVVSGTSMPVGTILWSAPPPIAEFSTQQIVQAVPTVNGPDLYSIDMDSNGDTIVRAFRSTGEQMWQSQVFTEAALSEASGGPTVAVGDNFGGVLLIQPGNPYANIPGTITDLDGQSGGQLWQYATSGGSISFAAIGLDGGVYVVETDAVVRDLLGNINLYGYVDSIDGVTGGLKNKIMLPVSTSYFHCPGLTSYGVFVGNEGLPVVAPDGSLYMEVTSAEGVEETNCDAGPQPFQFSSATYNLSLMRVSPDGGVGFSTLSTSGIPSNVIPDGNGGVLASYYVPSSGLLVTDTTDGATTTLSNISNYDNGATLEMVLGDNGTAFATDGYNVDAFAVATLQPTWSYTSQGASLSLLIATAGGGVAINDSELGVIQLDSSGNASAPVSSIQGTTPFRPGLPVFMGLDGTVSGAWNGILGGIVDDIAGPVPPPAASVLPEPLGGPTNRRASSGTLTNFTVNFTGSLSGADALGFNLTETCNDTQAGLSQQALGLHNCSLAPQYDWVWNVEIVATVSDDASKWIFSQSLAEERTGTGLNSQGQSVPFSEWHSRGCVKNEPCDNPPPGYVQQLPGQKTIFALDEPGSYTWTFIPTLSSYEGAIITMNSVQNFTSGVCNRANLCAGINWFLNLVISGGQLDRDATNANLGHIPF